jgi:GTPase SAR1 family protein
MGCGSSSPEAKDKKKNSKEIDAELAKQAKKEDSKIKLLLLGAGESGKSTIFKQMKIIYGAKFTEKERKQQLPTIHCNILQGIKILIDQI